MIINLVFCLADTPASQVDVDLEPLEGRVSEFSFEDHQGVRLDVSSRVLSDLWRGTTLFSHFPIYCRGLGRREPATFPPPLPKNAPYSLSHLIHFSLYPSSPPP